MADTEAKDLDFVDLYSCFPSAVQVAADELGLSHERPLTVTGGLTFGGGPLNNYVMHSIARTVELLRETPGGHGLVTGNGGNLYKHVHGVYASEPPERTTSSSPTCRRRSTPCLPGSACRSTAETWRSSRIP